MSRINTNVSSLLGQRVLDQNNRTLNSSLERLSTGLRINRGADDPAGLIASENLRSERASIGAAIDNAERAEQVVNVAEGGLQEINNLLLEVQSLVGRSANEAGLSREELEANQLQIDSILQTIDRISDTTSFQGTQLLNGNFDFNVRDQASTVESVTVNTANIPSGEDRDIQVLVTQSAQNAGLFLSTGATLDLADADSTLVFDLAGTLGSREFSFASGTAIADIASTINTFSDLTGLSATASGNGVLIQSIGLGDEEFVSVDVRDDGGSAGGVGTLSSNAAGVRSADPGIAFSAASNPIRDQGQDVGATINGTVATSDGTTARIASDFLDVEIDLSVAGAQTLTTIAAVTIEGGGGANFNLGPNVDIGSQVSIGIQSVASRNLGSETNGFLSNLASGQEFNLVDGDLNAAQRIVNDSIDEVTTLRGRLGAFQANTVGATIRSLGVALENTSAAESSIRDTDFAAETAALTRGQILVQAATNVLSIANNQPQNVLSLLG